MIYSRLLFACLIVITAQAAEKPKVEDLLRAYKAAKNNAQNAQPGWRAASRRSGPLTRSTSREGAPRRTVLDTAQEVVFARQELQNSSSIVTRSKG